jgi:hypothetical protein
VQPVPGQHRVQPRPHLGSRCVALDHPVVDRPALLAAAPGDHLDLDAIFLNIDPGGQEQAGLGHNTDAVALASLVESLPLRRLGFLLEREPQHRVDEALH